MSNKTQNPQPRRGASRSGKPQSGSNPWLAKGFAVLISVSGLLLMVLLSVKLIQLPIARVGVTGDLKYVSREQISELVAPHLYGGFIAVDLEGIRQVLQDLPWVSRVILKRQWPDGLNIEVHEHRAIAQWQKDSFVNSAGEVFTPVEKTKITELPRLSGPDTSQQQVMANYRSMTRLLDKAGLKLLSLEIDNRGSWRCVISGDRQLVLGRVDVIKRMQKFLLLYRTFNEQERRQLARIDLRYTNGLSVAWKDQAKVSIASR